ncbi:MAG: AAA family ATPase [Oscillatoriales cyanobacterium]|nr:MAG: AAA family ATPase [Oscillatoriales cyanobacterium]
MSYYVSPRFTEKVAVHVVKNFLNLPRVPVPLILGIHGKKGEGKTFQCNLVFEQMGIDAVHISGGELESPDAGDPARLLRLRYREASEMVKVRGRMCVLLINDIDAGAGRFDRLTQYTVNTQLVNATLMNIADNPTNVQLPGSYDSEPVRRIPIIVTGNDFGTLYAPLTRDGRMEKFYWEPTVAERLEVVRGMFEGLGLPDRAVGSLVDQFPGQSVDFFGAMKSRVYDDLVRQFIQDTGLAQVSNRLLKSREALPQFAEPRPTLEQLEAIGQALVNEQDRIRELHLAAAYNPHNQPHNQPQNQPHGQTHEIHGQTHGQTIEASDRAAVGPAQNGNGQVETNGLQGRSRPYSAEPQPSAPEPAVATHTHTQPIAPEPKISSVPRPKLEPELPPLSGNPDLEAKLEYRSGQRPKLVQPLGPTIRSQLVPIVNNGYRLGIEVADKRHYNANSWQCYGTAEPHQETEAIGKLEICLAENLDCYVRLVAIDPDRKQRIREVIVQRPQ